MSNPKFTAAISFGGAIIEAEIEIKSPITGPVVFVGDPLIDGNLAILCTEQKNNRGVFWTRTGTYLPNGAIDAFAQTFCQANGSGKLVSTAYSITVSPNGGVLQFGGNGEPVRINIQRNNADANGNADSGRPFFSTRVAHAYVEDTFGVVVTPEGARELHWFASPDAAVGSKLLTLPPTA